MGSSAVICGDGSHTWVALSRRWALVQAGPLSKSIEGDIMRFVKQLALAALAACAFFGSTGVAEAACTTTNTNQVTCTGGQGASVAFAGTGTASNATNHASTYPATLAVPAGNGAGQIPAGATV